MQFRKYTEVIAASILLLYGALSFYTGSLAFMPQPNWTIFLLIIPILVCVLLFMSVIKNAGVAQLVIGIYAEIIAVALTISSVMLLIFLCLDACSQYYQIEGPILRIVLMIEAFFVVVIPIAVIVDNLKKLRKTKKKS
ncbi:MAG TPA: hypothetical protein VG965_04515 [Patescibacteria group bacterium]|nr:hypothetical protein [Patescibacteria group bacterium]